MTWTKFVLKRNCSDSEQWMNKILYGRKQERQSRTREREREIDRKKERKKERRSPHKIVDPQGGPWVRYYAQPPVQLPQPGPSKPHYQVRLSTNAPSEAWRRRIPIVETGMSTNWDPHLATHLRQLESRSESSNCRWPSTTLFRRLFRRRSTEELD